MQLEKNNGSEPTEDEVRSYAELHHVPVDFARAMLKLATANSRAANSPATASDADLGDQIVAKLEAQRGILPRTRPAIPVSALSLRGAPDAGDRVVDAMLQNRAYQGA